MEAQRSAIQAEAQRRGWQLMTVYTGVARGNRTNGRPQLEEVLKDLADRRADALIVAKLDRVSRSVVDFGSVLTSVRSCLPWSRMIRSDGAGKQWDPAVVEVLTHELRTNRG